MRISYSPEADALLVRLAKGRAASTTKLGPGINVDQDAKGRLLSLEVLGASGWYPRSELEQLGDAVQMISIADAVEESGLESSTLRRQLIAGKIQGGVKRGQDWSMPRHELWNYLESRTGVGRPPASAKGLAVREAIRRPSDGRTKKPKAKGK